MQPIAPSDAPSRTVVVVDFDSITVTQIRRVLSRIGYKVIAFNDAQKAITFCQSGTIFITFLMARIVLPGNANGIAVAEAVTTRNPATKTILISHYATRTLLKLSGFENFSRSQIIVPFTDDELIKMVGQLADNSTPTMAVGNDETG